MAAASDLTYYIGQGQCFYAPRQTNGPIIGGYQYFGDTQSLQITSKQKTVEVEENVTGFGGVALHAPVSIPLDFKLQLPIWSMKNLALALFGSNSGANAGGTVSGEAVTAYADGGMSRLANFGLTAAPTLATATGSVTSITITQGAGYTTAPSVTFSAPPAGGVQALGHAVLSGSTLAIVLDNPGEGYTTAPTVTLTGGGFTTAATATAAVTPYSLIAGTDFSYNATYGQITLLNTGTSKFVTGGLYGTSCPIYLTAGYSYGANNGAINMLSTPSPEVSLMFNGLNVANPNGSTFSAVPVLIKRAKLDFTKALSLIDKKEGILELDGAILYDATATDGVPYGLFAKA